MEGLTVTFVGIIQVVALYAAYQLGRQSEVPESKWPKGSFMSGGWKARRIPYFILVGTAAFMTLFLPILANGGLGNIFGGLGMGSFFGGGRGFGRRGAGMGGYRRGASYGGSSYGMGGRYGGGGYDVDY